MISDQRFPEHEQAWLKFFQMLQQHLQSSSPKVVQLPNYAFNTESLAEYVSEVLQHVNDPTGKKALESAGINPRDLTELLRETQEYLSYSKNSRNQYLEPLKRYHQLKERSGRMQEPFQPQDDLELQAVRQKVLDGIESEQPMQEYLDSLDSHPPYGKDKARQIAEALKKDKSNLLAEFPQEDAKKIISDYYDPAIRRHELPDV